MFFWNNNINYLNLTTPETPAGGLHFKLITWASAPSCFLCVAAFYQVILIYIIFVHILKIEFFIILDLFLIIIILFCNSRYIITIKYSLNAIFISTCDKRCWVNHKCLIYSCTNCDNYTYTQSNYIWM